jgi:hypothetical protein
MPIFEDQNDADERQRLIDRFWKQLEILKPDLERVFEDALLYGAMDDFDQTTEIFIEFPSYATRVWHPILIEYRKSDQFKNYLRQTRIEAYWREHGWPDFCRPLGDDDFECD